MLVLAFFQTASKNMIYCDLHRSKNRSNFITVLEYCTCISQNKVANTFPCTLDTSSSTFGVHIENNHNRTNILCFYSARFLKNSFIMSKWASKFAATLNFQRKTADQIKSLGELCQRSPRTLQIIFFNFFHQFLETHQREIL